MLKAYIAAALITVEALLGKIAGLALWPLSATSHKQEYSSRFGSHSICAIVFVNSNTELAPNHKLWQAFLF